VQEQFSPMILIALGGNLPSPIGLPPQTLDAARAYLESHGVRFDSVSSYYVTPAWPDPRDPKFTNAVAKVETALPPHALMALLHETETAFGRVRSLPNAPRTLDLDLLDYDGRIEQGPPALPHPRLSSRAFVLVPLAEVAPDWAHPVTGASIRTLIETLPPDERAAISRA
jgi:2-amino-4-hydroxy-6-hydroxymethyldihydropteridine diphosphokinase